MSPLDAIFGLSALVVLFGAVSLSGVGLHLLTRRRAPPVVRSTDALKRFEPRGGRQRFSVRLFEAGALASVWILASGVLGLWAVASSLSAFALLSAMLFAGALVVATWWAWRRGVVRGPARESEPRVHLLSPRRRGRG